jgi:hypothetical protein
MREGVDVVITIGGGDFCPILPGRPYEECVLSIPSATHHPGTHHGAHHRRHPIAHKACDLLGVCADGLRKGWII